MTTQKQVADAAGTSLKTVSRVINNDPLVKEETRTRVLQVIEELGYTPNLAARMMRSQESNIVGFLANHVATTWSSTALINGAQDAAWRHGKQLMLFNVDGDEREQMAIEQLVAYRAEAVIYATQYLREVKLPEISNIPIVLLNCFDPEARYPAFVPDDYQTAFALTTEALDRGARRLVFMNVAHQLVAADLRARGFIDAGRARGVDLQKNIVFGSSLIDGRYHIHAYHEAKILLSQEDRPDTILCGQDTQALQVYLAAKEAGLRIGEDIAIASFDNEEPICSILTPGLSTMALPYFELGAAAFEAAVQPAKMHSEIVRMVSALFDRQSFRNSTWSDRKS